MNLPKVEVVKSFGFPFLALAIFLAVYWVLRSFLLVVLAGQHIGFDTALFIKQGLTDSLLSLEGSLMLFIIFTVGSEVKYGLLNRQIVSGISRDTIIINKITFFTLLVYSLMLVLYSAYWVIGLTQGFKVFDLFHEINPLQLLSYGIPVLFHMLVGAGLVITTKSRLFSFLIYLVVYTIGIFLAGFLPEYDMYTRFLPFYAMDRAFLGVLGLDEIMIVSCYAALAYFFLARSISRYRP